MRLGTVLECLAVLVLLAIGTVSTLLLLREALLLS